MWQPLGLVGVEEPLAHVVGQSLVEGLGQALRVAHARRHSLPDPRGHHVGRVPGEEDPSGPPSFGRAYVVGVDDRAQHLDVVGADPLAFQQLEDTVVRGQVVLEPAVPM